MALYVIHKMTIDGKPYAKEREWHTGEKKLNVKAYDVLEIQADCDELELIFKLFGDTIPRSTEAVQNWFGDTAQTIFSALPR